jgi:hypothetical protein
MVQSFALSTLIPVWTKTKLTVFNLNNNSLWPGSYLSDGWSYHRTFRLPVSLLRRLSRWQHEQDYTLITTKHFANPWLIKQYARILTFRAKQANRITTLSKSVCFHKNDTIITGSHILKLVSKVFSNMARVRIVLMACKEIISQLSGNRFLKIIHICG